MHGKRANDPNAQGLQRGCDRMRVDRHGQVELSVAFHIPIDIGWRNVLEHVQDRENAAEQVAKRERRQIGVEGRQLVLERAERAPIVHHAYLIRTVIALIV